MPTDNAMATTELEGRDTDRVPDQTIGLEGGSEDVLKQWLELATTGQRTATGTIRKFVDTVDKVVPLDGVGLARRREVISAALEMTQRLIHTPYDLGRGLVQSAVLVNVDVDVDIASRTPTT